MRFFAALILCIIGAFMMGIGIWSEFNIGPIWWIVAYILIIMGIFIYAEGQED